MFLDGNTENFKDSFQIQFNLNQNSLSFHKTWQACFKIHINIDKINYDL